MQETKKYICKICGEPKPATEYYPQLMMKNGIMKKCKTCFNEAQRGKKKEYMKKYNEKRKGQKYIPTGERALFLEIWNERPHKSEVTGKPILRFDVKCFSHLLSKGAYPEYRLFKPNIVLKTVQEHIDWHNLGREDLLKKTDKWQKIFDVQDQLKKLKCDTIKFMNAMPSMTLEEAAEKFRIETNNNFKTTNNDKVFNHNERYNSKAG